MKSIYTLIFLALSVCVFALNITYRLEAQSKTPSDAFNTFAMGNFEDYHQYMMIIKLGTEGKLLYHNAYSEESIPDVLLQPFYTVIGIISRPFHLSLYDIYFYARLSSLGILFFSVYLLIIAVFQKTITRSLATVVYFSTTGLWTVLSQQPFIIQKQPLGYANFDIYLKYLVIPPHHNIAIALLIFIMLLASKPFNSKSTVLMMILTVLLFIIHPYIAYMLLLSFYVHAGIQIIRTKTFHTVETKQAVAITISALPMIGYYIYLYSQVLRMSIGSAGILTYLPRAETFVGYIHSLGPAFFLALPVLVLPNSYKQPHIRLLLIWAFLPILLFFLPDLHVPFNTWRLFQIYQHIPLSLLAVYSVVLFIGKKPYYLAVAIVVSVASLLYGGTSLIWTYSDVFADPKYFSMNRYIPDREIAIYNYLNSKTPEHSVVIAGTYVSNVIPSFTHNHVVIGHNGDNRNFIEKQKDIGQFLGQNIPGEKLYDFLKKYNASYIIFGVDAPKFADTIYATLPFLKEVYEFEGLSVVQFIE